MKKIAAFLVLVLSVGIANGQVLYTKAFGDPKGYPIIFLHGGPGYNSVAFEQTTAQMLADNGFYVIVYDRRGEGRSADANAKFTFAQTFDDLKNVYHSYGLKKATLIGHSFGGIVAVRFAERYPEYIDHIILVSAPVSLQATFKTILKSSKAIYLTKKDSVNLKYIYMLEQMDTTSLEYGSYCFGHAMQNGFYFAKDLSTDAKALYATFKTDSLIKKNGSQMTYEAPRGFWQNEHYTTIDLTMDIQAILAKKIKLYGLYGKDDGLYATEQVVSLQHAIGEQNLIYYNNCSHNVFIDQQQPFIDAVKQWQAQ